MGITITWTGTNLDEIRELDPLARRWPRPEGLLLILRTDAGVRTLPPGSLVYTEDGEVRAYSGVTLETGLCRLTEKATS